MSSWTQRRIGDLVALANGASIRKKDIRTEGAVAVYGANGRLGFAQQANVESTTISIGRVGSCGAITLIHGPAWVSDNAMFVKSKSADVDWDFLFHLLSIQDFAEDIRKGAMPSLSQKPILRKLVSVPHITEQRRIVARISECMERVDEIEALAVDQASAGEQVLQAMRREALGSPLSIPDGWSEVRMDELADVIYGISAAISKNKDSELGPPIVRMANISLDGQLDLSDLRYCPIPAGKEQHFALRKGDLLLNWRSGSAKHVGKTALFDEEGLFTCASFILRIRSNPEASNNHYLRHMLNYMRAKGVFSGQSRMQINHKLNAKEFSAFPIRIPPTVGEQQDVAEQLDAAEALSLQLRLEVHSKQSEVQLLRASILRKAFAGEL